MKIEHFAINVSEPVLMAAWYGEHLATGIKVNLDDPAQTHFLIDSAGSVMLEIYNHPRVSCPRNPPTNPKRLFVENSSKIKQRSFLCVNPDIAIVR